MENQSKIPANNCSNLYKRIMISDDSTKMINYTGIRKKSISVLFAVFYTRDACMVIDGIFSYLINEKHDL